MPLEDPHRPRFHFSPGQWMNDSIPFYWNGTYHYFFLHNPAEVKWSAFTSYGHAASADLVHWERLPDALVPTPGGPDGEGCWTGSIAESAGVFYLFYTAIPAFENGAHTQLQCLATSRDLTHWDKFPGNPLGVPKPGGYGDCFRDPLVWREADGGWRMGIGGSLAGSQGGTVFLYHSQNLTDWEYTGLLAECETVRTGHECECPDFFALGDTSVLISSSGKTWWQTGTYRDGRFTMSAWGPADSGKLYAAKTLLDGKGRRLLLGWVQEDRPEAEQQAAGWSGVLSLPRHVTLRPDGAAGFAPVPELQALRGAHTQLGAFPVSEIALLDGLQSDSFELKIEIDPGTAETVGVAVRCAPGGAGGAALLWDRAAQSFCGAPLPLAPGELLSLHVFVDRSVAEVFANGRVCHTARIYPDRPQDCLGAAVIARGGTAQVRSADVWELNA